jgi:hypothetical protein
MFPKIDAPRVRERACPESLCNDEYFRLNMGYKTAILAAVA